MPHLIGGLFIKFRSGYDMKLWSIHLQRNPIALKITCGIVSSSYLFSWTLIGVILLKRPSDGVEGIYVGHPVY